MTIDRREFLRAGTFFAAGLVAAPALASCKLESRVELADEGFNRLRDRYFRQQLTRNPVTGTYLGAEGWDPALAAVNGRLRDYSVAALEDEADEFRTFERSLTTMDPVLLSPQGRVDHALMSAQLAFLQYQHDRRYHERSVDTYVAEPFRGIDWQLQQMKQFGAGRVGDEPEWRMVVARLRAIPAYLATARANLDAGRRAGNVADRRMVQRDGIAGSRANAVYFRKTLPGLAKDALGAEVFGGAALNDVGNAGEKAAEAYEAFAAWLEQSFPPNDRVDRFAIGESAYEWRVRTVLRDPRSAGELFEYGAQQVEDYTRRIAEVAERIAREKGVTLSFGTDAERAASIRWVMQDLSSESPANDDELLRWYRETAARAVAYGREQAMFEVPADYSINVVPTPPVLRGTIDAAYYPAPPLRKTGTGQFYVTPTGNDSAALRAQPRASIADTAVHEGFPGHDWHYKYMTAHAAEIPPVRWLTPGAVEDSSSMWSDSLASEGWGLYAEELMAEPVPGRPYGFYSPAEYLYELQGQLLRAARVRIDVGLHTGRMGFDDAVNYYTQRVSFYPVACARAATDTTARTICEDATRAVYRYSKWPTQAITYNLGKNAILALREAYRTRKGSAYSEREFHERFMRMGTIPSAFFRDVLLNG